MCSGLTEKELEALDAGICRMLENLTLKPEENWNLNKKFIHISAANVLQGGGFMIS